MMIILVISICSAGMLLKQTVYQTLKDVLRDGQNLKTTSSDMEHL